MGAGSGIGGFRVGAADLDLGVSHLLFIVRGVGALEKGQYAGADILGLQGHVVLLIFRFSLQAWGVWGSVFRAWCFGVRVGA